MLHLINTFTLLSALFALPITSASVLNAARERQEQLAFQPPPPASLTSSLLSSCSPFDPPSISTPVNVSSTANYVFNSLVGWMAQLPNTLHPNGHSLLRVAVPPRTTLYHARMDNEIFGSGYEWLAFDPEMSYGIFIQISPSTYLSTYSTTRALNLLAFDGLSSALGHEGWVASQDVLIGLEVGHSPEEWEYGEIERATRLCEWNAKEKMGLDGFVRTNSGNEILLCDFASGSLELVSHLDVSVPDIPITPGSNPWDDIPSRSSLVRGEGSFYSSSSRGEWIRSTTHRYLVPQPHITPDWSSFVTFYHPRLSSLVAARKGVSQMVKHTVKNGSREDVQSIREEIAEVLRRGSREGGVVDWGALGKDVVERYGDRLAHLKLILNTPTSDASTSFALIRQQASRLTYTMLNPFLETTYLKNTSDTSIPSSLWLPPAIKRCSTYLTQTLPTVSLTPQETILRLSMEYVTSRICLDVGDILNESLLRTTEGGEDASERLVWKWRAKVGELMDWLDWAMWTRCEEGCAWDQVCTLPLWPINAPWNAPIDPWTRAIVPYCKELSEGWGGNQPFPETLE